MNPDDYPADENPFRSVEVSNPSMEMQVALGNRNSLQEVQDSGQYLIRGLINCMSDDRRTIESLQAELLEARNQIDLLNIKSKQNEASAEIAARFESIMSVVNEKIEHFGSEIKQFMSHADVQGLVNREIDKVIEVTVPNIVKAATQSDSYVKDAFGELMSDEHGDEEGTTTVLKPEVAKAVLEGMSKDFEKCVSSADVKTRILMSLQKFVLTASDYVPTADGTDEHRIEILPRDHLPLDPEQVETLLVKVGDTLKQCQTKEQVIRLLHDEVKQLVTPKDEEIIKPKHDETWISVAAQDVMNKLSARIDELTTENDELRGYITSLKKQQADTFKLSSATDLATQKLDSKIDNAVLSFKEPLQETKKLLGGVEFRMDNVAEVCSKLSESVVKFENVDLLFANSSTNKFMPCLKEFVDSETLRMRELLNHELNKDIQASMKKSKEYMDVSLENVQKKSQDYVNACLADKLAGIEQANTYLRSSIATLDSQVARLQEQLDLAWTAQAKQVDNLSAKERLMEEFGRQFQVVDRNIAKLFDEHQAFVSKVDSEFSIVKDDILKAPTDTKISSMITNNLFEYNQTVERSLQDMVNNIQALSRSISSKADKDEVLQTISDRIKRLRNQLESHTSDEDLGAGLVTCLTCGTQKQREMSPPKIVGTMNDSMDSLSFERLSYTLGDDVLSREDYETMAGILKGDASLKPLGRQYLPMKPKFHPYLKRTNEVEPLYRRAKHANQLRELVKISSPERSIVSASSVVYRFEEGSALVGERAFSEEATYRRGKGGLKASKPVSRELRRSVGDLSLSSGIIDDETHSPESPVRLPRSMTSNTVDLSSLTAGSLPSTPQQGAMKGHLYKGTAMIRPKTSQA